MGALNRLVGERGEQTSRFADRFGAAFGAGTQIEDIGLAVDELAAFLVPIWNAVASRPEQSVLLATFGYVRCQLAWELTAGNRILVGIRALRASWEQATRPDDPVAALAVDVLLAHAETLLACLRAENALKCSCPVELESEAGAVADESANLLARSVELDGEWTGFRDEFLDPLLRSHELTYAGLREAARGVRAWVEHGREAAPALHHAITALERAERDPCVSSDVYASELRAHRAGLRALLARIGDPAMPDLRVEQAKLVYCYPFTVPDADGAQVCLRAAERAGQFLGARRLLGIAETELSDLWNAQGRQEPRYSGITIALPELTVRASSGAVLPGHEVSVRLSRLGNHYIRIERPIREVTLHDLNQAMRRVSSYMGQETITEHGGAAGPWDRLTDYVHDLGAELATALAGRDPATPDAAPDTAPDAAAGDTRAAEPASWAASVGLDFHVVLEVTAASVVGPDGDLRPATTDDVLVAVGAVVRAPLECLPTALEEWARFDAAEPRGAAPAAGPDPSVPLVNLAGGDAAYPGDFVGQTFGATLVVMLDTPHWAALVYLEHAEFTASLPPLLEGWRRELVSAIDEDHAKLDLLSSTALSRRRLALQDKVRSIQDGIALLHSLDLWKTLSDRRFAENMYSAAGLRDVEAELERTVERVELYYERLAALIAQKEERRNRRYQTLVELILALLAVSSLADVFGLVNDLFGLAGPVAAQWEIGLLAGAGALVGLVVLMVYKLRD